MNCQDFNTVVGELADGRPMDAGARAAGLEHAAVCASCAARLMDARAVGAALSVAASADTKEEAPARVKQSLLAAFAAQRTETTARASDVASASDIVPAPVVELKSRRVPRRWVAVAAAAAAVVLLSLALPSLVRVSPDSPQVPPPDMSAAVQLSSGPTPPSVDDVETPTISKATAQGGGAKGVTPRARKHLAATRGGALVESASAAQKANEYLPLTYLDASTAIESGTVVRVKLSRSALISLGVPVGVERADELMKAEVVLGDDGVARAIRLLR